MEGPDVSRLITGSTFGIYFCECRALTTFPADEDDEEDVLFKCPRLTIQPAAESKI